MMRSFATKAARTNASPVAQLRQACVKKQCYYLGPQLTSYAAFGTVSPTPVAKKSAVDGEKALMSEADLADHSWRQMNHIWSEAELDAMLASKDQKHTPACFSDKVMNTIMQTCYHSFNFVTGYKADNPPTKSIEWRLIVLESVAGVPGFMAAAFRHFHSLRSLQRDHGTNYTLLEEAENERMHLLVCLRVFEASSLTKAVVVAAQITMVPFLFTTYMIKPQAMHRFVGYLEETAVHTYASILKNIATPGTHLHEDWFKKEAPQIAINYWALKPVPCADGGMDYVRWYDVLRHILADEAHHRDVNHTYAELKDGDENPFVTEHMRNFDDAVARRAPQLLQQALAAADNNVHKK